MNTSHPATRRLTRPLALLLVTLAPAAFAAGETLPDSSTVHAPWTGGLDPRPTLTDIGTDAATGALLLKWSGVAGPYQVQRREHATEGSWTAVGGPTSDTSMSVPMAGAGMGVFRVQGQAAAYAGQEVCRTCHPTPHAGWSETAHKGALGTLKAIGMGNNAGCLPCHTVGFGTPGGFVSEATTPHLAGVQCENCHGPAANHIADPGDLTVRPSVNLSGTLCGGCHNGFHHPTFDEWLTAGHARVDPDFTGATGFLNPNRDAAVARMRACGACHSGAVRLAMLEATEEQPPVALPAMPSGDDAAKTGITCTVCHTSHDATPNGAQLRNPTTSTNFFSYSTATNTNFTLQYQENLQICAQCHNERGASWSSSTRPPHHSPQYNILIGNIGGPNVAGVDLSNAFQSSHRKLDKQCTHCHTHQHSPSSPSETNPVYTGHAFKPLPENCLPCHTAEQAEAYIGVTQNYTKKMIAEVKGLLDKWATTKAPEALRTRYGKLAWEFTAAGQLSQPVGGPTVSGPTAAEQAQIPDEIKKGRFLMYMVEHDGSYGVHNGEFSRNLLDIANALVRSKLQ